MKMLFRLDADCIKKSKFEKLKCPTFVQKLKSVLITCWEPWQAPVIQLLGGRF